MSSLLGAISIFGFKEALDNEGSRLTTRHNSDARLTRQPVEDCAGDSVVNAVAAQPSRTMSEPAIAVPCGLSCKALAPGSESVATPSIALFLHLPLVSGRFIFLNLLFIEPFTLQNLAGETRFIADSQLLLPFLH